MAWVRLELQEPQPHASHYTIQQQQRCWAWLVGGWSMYVGRLWPALAWPVLCVRLGIFFKSGLCSAV